MTLDAAVQNRSVVIELAYMGCSLLGSFLILRWALTRNDTSLKAKARQQKKELAKRWGRKVELDGEFENVIAREVVNPDLIDVTLDDIGGTSELVCEASPPLLSGFLTASPVVSYFCRS
jgi:hypothetical protein